jgi:hypothetical protein
VDPANRLLGALLFGTLGVVSLLFFPFAGFTERTAYVPGPIFREYGVTGLGTYGDGFNPFGFPAGFAVVQILMLALGAAMAVVLLRCWRSYRSSGSPADDLRSAARMVWPVAGAYVVLLVTVFAAVFPAVEERTIWVVESQGWLEDWWPRYGAFVTAIAFGAAAGLLTMRSRSASPPPPGGPAPPPAEPPGGPPPPPEA